MSKAGVSTMRSEASQAAQERGSESNGRMHARSEGANSAASDPASGCYQ